MNLVRKKHWPKSTAPTQRMLSGWARYLIPVVLLTISIGSISRVHAQEMPDMEKVLPETTVGLLHIPDVRGFLEKMKESSAGELMQQEQIAGIAAGLWEQSAEAFEQIEETELSLEEIASLPEGRITIAAVAPKRAKMEWIFVIEVGEENEAVDTAMEEIRNRAEEDGAELDSIESEDESDKVTFETIVGDGNTVTYFRKDGFLVASTSEEELQFFLDRWMGREVEKIRPLSENRKYATIMNRCKSPSDLPPELVFFYDPIEFTRSAYFGEPSVQFGINFLPLLGLDGVNALGAAVIMNEGDFESVMHGHLLLASPREGVVDMLAMKEGNYEPPEWVPANTARYMSSSWDIPRFMTKLEEIVDLASGGGPGTFRQELDRNINERFEFDLEEDLLDILTGRISMTSWLEPPARLNSEAFMFSLEIKEGQEEEFEDVFEDLRDVVTELSAEGLEDANLELFDEVQYKGYTYYVIAEEFVEARDEMRNERIERFRERRREQAEEAGEDPGIDRFPRDDEEDEEEGGMEFREQNPAFGVIGNEFLIASPDFFEHAVDTFVGAEACLADDKKYKRVAREMFRLAGSDTPCMTMYTRPSIVMKNLYEVAQQEQTMDLFDREDAMENRFAQGVRNTLEENPLPDFEEIEHLFPEQGAYVTTDDTGFHLLVFQLKPEVEDEEDGDDKDAEK